MKLFSPAKINLSLKILGKRKDGYHNIKSIFQTVSLYDEIFISSTKSDKEIEFVCKPEVTKNPEENLAYKAWELLKEHTGEKRKVKIEIIKNIPVGAGLGGGSSDAGSILKGLAKFWDIKISINELKKLALKLGADVPFFLYGGKCLVEGIGEKIRKLNPENQERNNYILLIWPGFGIPTKEIYEMFDKFYCKKKVYTTQYPINDLEEVVFRKYPELKKIKEKLIELGAKFSLMSGSGSTIFGVFEKRESAVKAKNQFRKYKTWLVRPVYRVSSS